MTENDIKLALQELVDLTLSGRSLDAFDKFYADNLDRADLDGALVVGKAQIREGQVELGNKITAVRTFECPGVVVSGNRAFVTWHADYDHADFGTVHVREVAVQDWENGKIVRERFYA